MKKRIAQMMTAVALLAVLMLATGCCKVDVPIVVIEEQSVMVSYDKALMVAKVTDDGGGKITECGFCYGKTGEALDTLLCEGAQALFSAELSGLSLSTDYTCMAFARNEAGRGYSDVYRFTTTGIVDTIPVVVTYTVKEITYCSAVPSGQVLCSGGQEVEERGICYGTEPLPTVEGTHVALGNGLGPFECQLTDLISETTYFVRAYAICTEGTYYGDQLAFDTKVLPMAVRTISTADMTDSRVFARGEVIRDGGLEVTECGFCWGTSSSPTIDGPHINVSFGLGEYGSYFSGLEWGQTNYVRAYAVNDDGVAYGNELELVPDNPYLPWDNGVSPGLFSVGENHQVRFSQGNLQYYPDDNIWRFAEHQWDFVGGSWDTKHGTQIVGTVFANGVQCDNTRAGRYYAGWMDLFGWGTSGWNNGNTYYRPYDMNAHLYEQRYYGPPGNYDLTGDYEQADWGVHNHISNGGSRSWRTPTIEEYNYLLFERETPSGARFAMAFVAGIAGMIVLPDDWDESTYFLNGTNELGYFSVNTITGREWLEVLNPAGAVFLPTGGIRYQFTDYDGAFFDWFDVLFYLPQYLYVMWNIWYENNQAYASIYNSGAYWTSSQFLGDEAAGVNYAYAMKFVHDSMYTGYCAEVTGRANGCSVRLISDE